MEYLYTVIFHTRTANAHSMCALHLPTYIRTYKYFAFVCMCKTNKKSSDERRTHEMRKAKLRINQNKLSASHEIEKKWRKIRAESERRCWHFFCWFSSILYCKIVFWCFWFRVMNSLFHENYNEKLYLFSPRHRLMATDLLLPLFLLFLMRQNIWNCFAVAYLIILFNFVVPLRVYLIYSAWRQLQLTVDWWRLRRWQKLKMNE